MENDKLEVGADGLDAALQELSKAAELTDTLSKGYGGTKVDTNGHTDERGSTSGGLPGGGDVGGLDDMMIAKMQQTLAGAGFGADAIAAFMKKDEDEDEDKDDKKPAFLQGKMSDDEDEEDEDMDKSFAKSFDSFAADEDLAEGMNAFPFLQSLVAKTTESIDQVRKSQVRSGAQQSQFNHGLAKSMAAMGQLVKGLVVQNNALNERLGLVEAQPAAARGVQSLSGASAVRKSFGAHGVEGQTQLTKSDVLRTLSFMNLEKGIRDIGGVPTSHIVTQYEAVGEIAPQAMEAVQGFLASHPHEAKMAKSYR